MTPETGLLAAGLCFLLAVLYTAFQLLRLIFPVWAWRWEKNALALSELLSRASAWASARQIAESAPAQTCFNRLMQEKEVTSEERPFQVRFRRRILLAVICAGLLAYLRFTGKFPPEAPLLAADAVLVAVGMMFGELARYRIWKTQVHAAQMVLTEEALAKEASQAPQKQQASKTENPGEKQTRSEQ